MRGVEPPFWRGFLDSSPLSVRQAPTWPACSRSFNHSPLEGESANQGPSPRIFRWGEKAVPLHTSSASSAVHARPLQPPCKGFSQAFPGPFSVGFSTCHSRAGGNPVMASCSNNHSPLEGESANQGRSPRIFRWGEIAVPLHASSASGVVHARPLQPPCKGFSQAIPGPFSVGFSTCHSRSSMPSKVSIGGGNPDKPSREARPDAVGGPPTHLEPFTFSQAVSPRNSPEFQAIRNCFRSAAQTSTSSRLRYLRELF